MTLLSILGSDAIAVPLAPAFPTIELRHVLNDCSASVLLSSSALLSRANEVLREGIDAKPVVETFEMKRKEPIKVDDAHTPVLKDRVKDSSGALMLYTSGTTSKPVCNALFLQEDVTDADSCRKAYYFL